MSDDPDCGGCAIRDERIDELERELAAMTEAKNKALGALKGIAEEAKRMLDDPDWVDADTAGILFTATEALAELEEAK